MKDEWRTPPDFYSRLNAEFSFGLDAACTRANCLAPRGIYHDEDRDALAERWIPRDCVPWFEQGKLYGRGTVWLNPPYSALPAWMEKAAEQGRQAVVIALVPADTSTRWWYDFAAQRASEIRFVRGRVRFHKPDGTPADRNGGGANPTHGSAVVIFAPPGGPPRYSYMEARPSPAPLL